MQRTPDWLPPGGVKHRWRFCRQYYLLPFVYTLSMRCLSSIEIPICNLTYNAKISSKNWYQRLAELGTEITNPHVRTKTGICNVRSNLAEIRASVLGCSSLCQVSSVEVTSVSHSLAMLIVV